MAASRSIKGPSPLLLCPHHSLSGSIPAPAGETDHQETSGVQRYETGSRALPGVHPRACGGNLAPESRLGLCRRVHPRACGGNACIAVFERRSHGSIPAPAGETSPIEAPPTDRIRSIPAPAGETLGRNGRQRDPGSIPAPAGETPSRDSQGTESSWVHPRACGGNILTVQVLIRLHLGAVHPRACGGNPGFAVWDA